MNSRFLLSPHRRLVVARAVCACAALLCTAATQAPATQALAADAPCEGEPSGVRLDISVERVARAQGLMAATIYPDDPKRFLAHHGQIALVRGPAETPSTPLCVWLPTAGRYEVAVYQDLNSDHRFNRTRLGLPAEPYGLSNDPPNLLGLPTFRSVRFSVHEGENLIHIPLHNTSR